MQLRYRETDLFGKFAPCRCFRAFAAPDATTRQVPPDAIRAAHEQQCWPDMNGYHGALMLRDRQPPPDAGKREAKAKCYTPGTVAKCGEPGPLRT